MMKCPLLIMLTSLYLYSGIKDACTIEENNSISLMADSKIKITVNSQIFTATLLDNKAATSFKAMLPLTLKMRELNGNEKYSDLPKHLPSNSYNPETINSGDLMVYGTNTIVLFYKNFSTPYSYTKIGAIDDVKNLTNALGPGNVTVVFELE